MKIAIKSTAFFVSLLLILSSLMLAACFTAPDARAVLSSTALETTTTSLSTISPVPTASPTPTSVPTTVPAPSPTSKPTPRPTAVGAVVLAEGFYSVKLDAALKARITGLSYPKDDSGCPISYNDLRYIKLLHYNFEGQVQVGELMVNAKLAQEVMEIFYKLYQAKYALTSVRLVDDYGEPGDDNLSMAANNTSAFNFRRVSGTTTLSRHSYGAAIDVNPMLNPYIVGDRIAPANGAEFVDRTRDFTGKIDHDDLCYKLFIACGWTWGGDWRGDKDYQHFSKNINN